MKICCIADVYQILGPLGYLVAGLPPGVVLVHVACNLICESEKFMKEGVK